MVACADAEERRQALKCFSLGSGSQPGVSRKAGVAGRDELGLRRRGPGAVGHVRRRVHVSPTHIVTAC